ncbi:MAG: regulatory protein RecX [Lachnospiraceae bacterium]|nr:regulatory protein RecX [Lachnospiraceae bacterium]
MRVVTDIQEFSKQKYSIYVDEEFAFVLYRGELSSYGLKRGKPIEEEKYQQITRELLPKRAKKRCLNLLKTRAYTEMKLRQKLREGKYPEESIEEAIEYVKSYGYIDDYDYACQYIAFHKEKESRRKLEEKLSAKGISPEVLQRAFLSTYEEGEEEELQLIQARKLLCKKNYQPQETDWKERQKLFAFLMRKGIPSEIIRRVLETEEWEE